MPGMPFNFGAIGQGVAGTIQSGVGLLQYRKAKKLYKEGQRLQKEAYAKRTDYQIPDEIKNNVALAQNEAFGKPAVQSYLEENANQKLSGNLSAVRRYATSSADALALASGANTQANMDMNSAAVAGAQQRQQNMQSLYQANSNLGDHRALAWDLNVNVPFLQRLQWSQDLMGTGYQGQNDATNTFIQGQNQIGESAATFFGGGGGGGGGGF